MNPGGSNPSRPPQSRPPAYASAPTHDPETGHTLDAEAQALIARLMRNAAIDPDPSRSAPSEPLTGMEGLEGKAAKAGELDWLNDGSWENRTAGAHYTPSQQRELIDEEGVARNADKLDLSHTHYEARRNTTTADDFAFGW
jgi:hypothetical protein